MLAPTLIYKAVYDPGWKHAGAYLVRNADDSDYAVISVDQLTQLTGVDVFPAMPSAVKHMRLACRSRSGGVCAVTIVVAGTTKRRHHTGDQPMTLPKPFADDTASASIGGLTVENGLDRIALYGNLEITRDVAGLKLAGELARFLDQAIAAMAADKALPERIAPPATPTTVRNPFA